MQGTLSLSIQLTTQTHCTVSQSHPGSQSRCFREWGEVTVLCTEKPTTPYLFPGHPQNSQARTRCGLYVQALVKTSHRYRALSMVHVQGEDSLPRVVTTAEIGETEKYGTTEIFLKGRKRGKKLTEENHRPEGQQNVLPR